MYNELMTLCNDSDDAFFFKDFERDDHHYRIFNYRMASYTDFLRPSALECRGIMFEIRTDEINGVIPIRLASRPMEKFFNKDENPLTMNLDFSDMKQIMYKADGSLISSYMNGGQLCLKSKGSLFSEQAAYAEHFINQEKNEEFKDALQCITVRNATVNMEWCAPNNRIVLGYTEPQLIVLNVRNNKTGMYYDLDTVIQRWPAVAQHWVELVDPTGLGIDFINSIYEQKGIEGYVVMLPTGPVKIKTEWYVVQHRAKDSINSPRRLFEAVLEEATDDLRTLFHDDELIIQRIEEMELFVEHLYNPLVAKVEKYYEDNKEQDVKTYAVQGQIEFPNKGEFGLAMSLYKGRETNFKEYLKKNYKHYGIRDEEPEDGE